ncbi:MAG: amino acid permease, partial [Actinomycetota bacterium]|nr:amino acid permease [Actinomycetota bacterium]
RARVDDRPAIVAVVLAALAVVVVGALAGGQTSTDDLGPLAAGVWSRAGSLDWLAPAVRIGGTVAALGVLLSLIAGVSRTAFAMAANGDLPRVLDAVHPDHRVPHRAELAAGAAVAVLVLVADLRNAIGFSSFAVLTYYAIANAAAWTLPAAQRRWPRTLSVLGVVGCALLAFTLPVPSVLTGGGVLALGALIWFVRAARLSRPTTATD